MRELGVSAYRFSVAWPRVLPRGPRRAQRSRARLLRPADRRCAGGGHRAVALPLPLGPAAGAAGPGRMAEPRHRGLVRRLCDAGRRAATAIASSASSPSTSRRCSRCSATASTGTRRASPTGGAASGHPSREPGAWRRRRCAARRGARGVDRRHPQRAAGPPGRPHRGRRGGGDAARRILEQGLRRAAAPRPLSAGAGARHRTLRPGRRHGAHLPPDRLVRAQPLLADLRPGRRRRAAGIRLGRRPRPRAQDPGRLAGRSGGLPRHADRPRPALPPADLRHSRTAPAGTRRSMPRAI